MWNNSKTRQNYHCEKGSTLQQVYEKKIQKVPPELLLNNIGYEGGLKYVLDESAILFIEYEPYARMKEYPCQITTVKSIE